MNHTDYMQAAIDHAMERKAAIEAEHGDATSSYAVGWVDTPAGQLEVNMVVARGASTFMATHWRKRWTLDGKTIAAAKISTALQQVGA